MWGSGRGRIGRPVKATTLLAAVMTLALVGLGEAGVRAAERPTAEVEVWQQVGLTEHAIDQISTPRSGALLARAGGELWRSDDAGLAWRPVQLPAGIILTPRIYVDPHDHTTVYVQTPRTVERDIRDPLMRSRDEGASWLMILPSDWSGTDSEGIHLSEAQSGLLYSRQKAGQLRRSEDGGDTWVDLSAPSIPHPTTRIGCVDSYWFFPHPTNSDVLYRVSLCRVNNVIDRGAELPARTEVSRDRGSSWAPLAPSPFRTIYASLIGCGANAPDRLYLMDREADAISPASLAPTFLLRSDDSGQTWRRVRGGEDSGLERNDQLVCDPTRPDQVFLLRSQRQAADLRVSQDAGQTWSRVDLPSGVKVNSIAVGVDGRYLFLATDAGVWRRALTD